MKPKRKKETGAGAKFSMLDPKTQTKNDLAYAQAMESYYQSSPGTHIDKLRNFTKFVPRQILSMFLAKHALFEKIVNVHGHIIECGVFLGGGLMTWGQLSAIYEPVNHVRRVIGFDTFTGFPSLHSKDATTRGPEYLKKGGLAVDSYDDLTQCINLYDLNRPIGHIPRIELVKGNALQTIPDYVEHNQHLVVAMLYLDFDLYEPTKIALKSFLPRMPRGAVVAFDELGQAAWPGETLAVLETLGLNRLRLQRFPYHSSLSYAVLE